MRVAAAISTWLIVGFLAVFAMGGAASAKTLEVEPDLLLLETVLNDQRIAPTSDPDTGVLVQSGVTCFKTGEQISGMNKICFYDCLGSTAAITIGAAQLCPLTIQQ
jgi:hypothetical protein